MSSSSDDDDDGGGGEEDVAGASRDAVGMMSIGTPSKKMRSECWSFFFSSLFGALCQRGRKLEGLTTFLSPWRGSPWRGGCYSWSFMFLSV